MLDSPRTPSDQPPEAHDQLALPAAPARLALTDGAPPDKPKRSHRGWWWLLAVLVVLGVALYFLWPRITGKSAAPATAKGQKGAAGAAAPVVAATARKGDIGVYFTGLGAVTPLATVTVRTRVDGRGDGDVRYREGDTVHKGDLLAEIDDGPYQAALTQAEGQLLRDQATLDNARIDLARYQLLVPQKAVPEQMLATQQALVHQDEGIVKLDEGMIESARSIWPTQRSRRRSRDASGLRLFDQGNIVQASDTNGLVVITQMDPISVIFTIAEDQLPPVVQKIAAGQIEVVPTTVKA